MVVEAITAELFRGKMCLHSLVTLALSLLTSNLVEKGLKGELIARVYAFQRETSATLSALMAKVNPLNHSHSLSLNSLSLCFRITGSI